MEYTYKNENGIGVYAISGTLLGESGGMQLANEFNERLEEGMKKFVLDLHELKHVNSSGLGVFITMYTRARTRGGEMVLLNPSEFIQSLLMITRLNSIFSIHTQFDEAVKHLESIR
jgi:anti-sigma B factor antagonist